MHSHSYPVPPEHLLSTLQDADYLAARQARFAGVGEPAVTASDGEVVVTTVRQLPMDKIPGAIKGFVGDGQITQVDTWADGLDAAGAAHGIWRGEVSTAPADIGGTYLVCPDGDGSRYDIDVRVKVKVPLIGAKIEQQVRGYLDHIIAKEQDFLAEWLRDQ